jgi:hypothetical protein
MSIIRNGSKKVLNKKASPGKRRFMKGNVGYLKEGKPQRR